MTGHSLGGALSTLCAYDCARRTWRGVPRPAIVHYNYGSPRVGNKAFAEQVRRHAAPNPRSLGVGVAAFAAAPGCRFLPACRCP